MSRTSQTERTQVVAEEFVWPEFNPSIGYRGFIERLRLARLERGLSIADMSDEVGLTFRLAHEFETLAAPLPFEWLEVWCQVVGVPFEDFLTIYWADQSEWDERQARERESEAESEADALETSTTELPPVSRSSVLPALRAAFERIANFFRSRYSTP